MRIDENNYETIKKVESITLGDYNIYWKDAENIDGYIDSYDMFNMVSDLLCEVESLHELIQDMKNPGEFDEHTAFQDQCLEEELR